MKISFLITILFLLFSICLAQEQKVKRFNIKVQPQQLLMHTHLLSGEYFIGKQRRKSINISVGKTYRNYKSDEDGNMSYAREKGAVFAFEYRYYWQKFVNKGFYIATCLRADYLVSDFAEPTAFGFGSWQDSVGEAHLGKAVILAYKKNVQTIYSISVGIHIGFQYVFLKYCILDLYVGLAGRYAYTTYKYGKEQGGLYPVYAYQGWLEKSVIDKLYIGIIPKLGFQVGFAF